MILAAAFSLDCTGGTGVEPWPGNLLLISVDTLRPDYLSRYGYDLSTSPFADSLFTDGTTFTNAVTPIPRTTQALSSLLTGRYPHGHGVRTLTDPLPTSVPVLAEAAKEAGYATLAIVSNHLLTPERGLGRGFDVYDSAPDAREATQNTQTALRYLKMFRDNPNRSEHLFVWVHYIDPHVPYYPPPAIAERFAGDYRGPYRTHFGDIKGGIGNYAYPRDLGKEKAVFQNDLPPELNAHVRRLYAGDIRATDDAMAQLVRWVFANLGEDWIIVFTADHGESLGERGFFYDHGDYVYNAGMRVPLDIAFPKDHPLHGKRKIDDWVSLIDIAPTLRELLGWPYKTEDASASVDGSSLVPLLAGGKFPKRAVFAECGRSYFPQHIKRRKAFTVSGRFRAVIRDDWKLIWTPGGRDTLEFELYDLKSDSHETRNLYRRDHPRVAALSQDLRGWIKTGPVREVSPSAEDMERLRSLGYTN